MLHLLLFAPIALIWLALAGGLLTGKGAVVVHDKDTRNGALAFVSIAVALAALGAIIPT